MNTQATAQELKITSQVTTENQLTLDELDTVNGGFGALCARPGSSQYRYTVRGRG